MMQKLKPRTAHLKPTKSGHVDRVNVTLAAISCVDLLRTNAFSEAFTALNLQRLKIDFKMNTAISKPENRMDKLMPVLTRFLKNVSL